MLFKKRSGLCSNYLTNRCYGYVVTQDVFFFFFFIKCIKCRNHFSTEFQFGKSLQHSRDFTASEFVFFFKNQLFRRNVSSMKVPIMTFGKFPSVCSKLIPTYSSFQMLSIIFQGNVFHLPFLLVFLPRFWLPSISLFSRILFCFQRKYYLLKTVASDRG